MVIAGALLTASTVIAQVQTVQLAPSKDTTLYDESDLLSNGAGQHFFVGRTSSGAVRRALIAFDIAGNIPPGARIESAALTVHMSRARGPEVEIDLQATLSDWGEGASAAEGREGAGALAEPGDATWLYTFYDTDCWTQPGGDFASTISSSAAVSTEGFYTFDSTFDPGLTTDLQRWLDTPEANFGWVLKVSDEFFPMSAKRFDSRENAVPEFQPLLTVAYSGGR